MLVGLIWIRATAFYCLFCTYKNVHDMYVHTHILTHSHTHTLTYSHLQANFTTSATESVQFSSTSDSVAVFIQVHIHTLTYIHTIHGNIFLSRTGCHLIKS